MRKGSAARSTSNHIYTTYLLERAEAEGARRQPVCTLRDASEKPLTHRFLQAVRRSLATRDV